MSQILKVLIELTLKILKFYSIALTELQRRQDLPEKKKK
jgi:hypothetical protein